jgi:hypothetical protein
MYAVVACMFEAFVSVRRTLRNEISLYALILHRFIDKKLSP